MNKTIFLIAVLCAAISTFSQTRSTVKIAVKNHDTREPIAEASVKVKDSEVESKTDANGAVSIGELADGEYTFEIFSAGYETASLKLTLPKDAATEQIVFLELHNEVGEVTITSTRTGREIDEEPTRVEAIDEEEIDEKINMRPGNVSMVLHESTGIQVQQTSATANTQAVRIQGLDGRYTQILKDGFPAYGGFSGSLSVLEIPPLDLKQVEVIKGPAATLFGGDAIAGVVNFVTKDPEEKRHTTLLFNQTSALGTDASVFTTQKFERVGYTLLGTANFQKEYDVDDDDFSELPRTKAFGITPKFLFYLDKTSIKVGTSLSYQDRKGGDVFALRGRPSPDHTYFENDRSIRSVSTFNLDHEFADGSRLFAKQSFAFFERELRIPAYSFSGQQFNSFTDISYSRVIGKHALIFGGSAFIDRFRENSPLFEPRDEDRTAVGFFVQDTVDLGERASIEGGFRLETTSNYGTFALPRVSLLYRFTERFTTRLGVGFGYKVPTMFTEDAERLLFRSVSGIGTDLKAERSRGGTFDLNYKDEIGEKFTYSLNHMFFYTTIEDPIILEHGKTSWVFANAPSPVISRGMETNARLGYGIAKLFIGYTFTDAKAGYLTGNRHITLLPRHKVNSSLVFEEHGNFKAGAEFYYGSRQTLEDRSLTRSTAEVGLFAEKTFGKVSVFFNAENLTDVRQGRYGQVVIPPHEDPTFAEIYTHLEGRIFNGGIKIRF